MNEFANFPNIINSPPAWLILSLCAATAWAIVNVLDKYIVTNVVKRPSTIVAVALIIDIFLVLPVLAARLPNQMIGRHFAIALASGLLVAAFTLTYYRALTLLNPAAVAILMQMTPVFTALIGVGVFDEQLSPRSVMGILLIVLGGYYATFPDLMWQAAPQGRDVPSIQRQHMAIFALLAGVCLLALSYAAQKLALDSIAPLDVLVLSRIGALPVALALLQRSEVRDDIRELLLWRRSGGRDTLVIVVQALINLIGVYLVILAYAKGALSNVVAVTAVQPLLVVVLLWILGRAQPTLVRNRGPWMQYLWLMGVSILVVYGIVLLE